MSANIDLYEDSGVLTSGRGATITLADEWNLKNSALTSYVYYPTNHTTNAPLVRPYLQPGAQTLSYKKYLSFKIDGTYAKLKNIRIKLSIDSAAQTDKAQLFYKMTNVYAQPNALFDGDMNCISTNSDILIPEIWPMLSTVGPHLATSRNTAYGPNQTLYTNYIVVQMRVNNECIIGNSSEFKLRLEAYEYN